ncbi:MAG: hypothetical protein KC731_05145 [Myxococcales bacterium]|nr:hypothetical protein [Myxococcales bacterium]
MTRASLAIVVALVALAGCSKQSRVLNPKVQETPMLFESAQASETFRDALQDRYESGEADVTALRGRLSRNAFFNREVMLADMDGDGIISDREAVHYAQDP